VAGSGRVSCIAEDIKINGITREIMQAALIQLAKSLHILGLRTGHPGARTEFSEFAPP